MRNGFQRGFTLIEVLVATAIMVVFSTGLLATTWQIVGLAHAEAERMMADNLAHDVMRTVYCTRYAELREKAGSDWTNLETKLLFEPKTDLPQVVAEDIWGKKQAAVSPLWRDGLVAHKPYCQIQAKWKDSAQQSVLLKVTVHWWSRGEERTHSPMEQERTPFGDET